MAKRIWEFQSLSQIGDDTKFLVSQGENTRVVPGALINPIASTASSKARRTPSAPPKSLTPVCDLTAKPQKRWALQSGGSTQR